jgi:hypothetical protein
LMNIEDALQRLSNGTLPNVLLLFVTAYQEENLQK